MRTISKILAILFGLSVIGQLFAGSIFPAGIILALVFGYFGWREKPVKNSTKSRNNANSSNHGELTKAQSEQDERSYSKTISSKSNTDGNLTQNTALATPKIEKQKKIEDDLTVISDNDEYFFYVTHFKSVIDRWKKEHGTRRYQEIKDKVYQSSKIKSVIKKCYKEGGTFIGPEDVYVILNSTASFVFTKQSSQLLAGLLFVNLWHSEVNIHYGTFNPYQMVKYFEDVKDNGIL